MRFTVLTLFPGLIEPWTREAILGRALARGLLELELRNIRDSSEDKHRSVDDTPFGGGAGMVLRVDVLERSLADLQADEVIMLTPAGERFDQGMAEHLAKVNHLALLCGRYEGFDARAERLVTREVSLGDFVMMGGEAAALCVIEAVARLLPGVLGDEDSHRADSFSSGVLDYPEFTRPALWNSPAGALEVPEVLRGGNHQAIARWRRREALRRTWLRRPDLLLRAHLSDDDLRLLLECGVEPEALERLGLPLPTEKPKRRRSKPTSEEAT